VRKNRKINEETINYIFKRDKLARKFVAAFWDAEGSVRRERKYFHIYLYNSDTYLLDKIEEFLAKKKIDHSTRLTFEPGREYYLKGRKVKSKKKIYRISIPKSSMKKWTKEIGVHMFHTKKKKVVEEISDYLMGDKT
ncbi:MAG: LAGLIDADG family homing endonuclease, partial [Candidatus Micrarchaeota archaeon]